MSTALEILFEDERLVAIDKPAGMTVIPGRGEPPSAALVHVLSERLGVRLWIVHRLDRQTSGVLLFAKDAATHRALNLAFEHRQVHKTYVAWVAGARLADSGVIDVALHAARRGRMRPARPDESGALASRTRYQTERRWTIRSGEAPLECARVVLDPETGRQHQLRVHLRTLGAPILADDKYRIPELAGRTREIPVSRLALHATRLGIEAPGLPALDVSAPLSGDLVELERWLEEHAETQPSAA